MSENVLRYAALAVVFVIIMISPVTVFSGLLGIIGEYRLIIAISACLLTCILFLGGHHKVPRTYFIIILLQLSFLFGHSLVHLDAVGNFEFIVKLLFMPILLASFGFIGHERVADLFIRLMLVFSLLAFIQFFLIIFDLSSFEYHYQDISTHRQVFYGLSNSASIGKFGGIKMPRQGSFFIEPGSFTFMIFIAIVLNTVFKFSKRREYFLLIFGSVSFSLYYFLLVILYLSVKVKFKTIVTLLILIVIAVSLYFSFGVKNKTVDSVIGFAERKFFVRLIYLGKENNRMPGYKRSIRYIIESPIIGAGRYKSTDIKIGGSGYIRFIGMFGFFGAAILLGHIIISGYAVYKTKLLSFQDKAFIILGYFLMLIHREHVMQLIAYCFYFLVYAGAKQLRKTESRKKVITLSAGSYAV